MSLYHYCVLQSLIIIEYSSMSRGANSFIKLNQVFFRYQFRQHIDRCANLQSVYLSAFNTRFLNRPSTVKPGFVRILSICKHRQASIVSFSTLRISINTFVFHKITRLVGPSTPHRNRSHECIDTISTCKIITNCKSQGFLLILFRLMIDIHVSF